MIYNPKITLVEIRQKIRHNDKEICYSVHTCWWCLLDEHPGYSVRDLPCDPRGSVLLQSPAKDFISIATNNPSHYGEHGLIAFMAAYHGNVTTDNGKPTCFGNWDRYNELINEHIQRSGDTGTDSQEAWT